MSDELNLSDCSMNRNCEKFESSGRLNANDDGSRESDESSGNNDGLNLGDDCGKNVNGAAKERKKKRGIVYLSTTPKYMNVTKTREIFSEYGKVGRVYLQLAQNDMVHDKQKKAKKPIGKQFTEGWVEFESKKVAKYVAATLNNTQISTRKKSKFYDVIWNIKYLPRFKWVHLSERLAYERAVHKQRVTTEIAQAKREVNFFSHNVDRSKKLRAKLRGKEDTGFVAPEIKQRDTDMEIRMRKGKVQPDDRTEFLKTLFT